MGSVRHVGFAESIQMIGDAMGWTLTRITDEVRPWIAEEEVNSELLAVDPGYVAGISQEGIGYVGDEVKILLQLDAYRRPGVVRLGADRRLAPHLFEGAGRHPWRHRDRVDDGQFHPARHHRAARASDDARYAAAVVLPGPLTTSRPCAASAHLRADSAQVPVCDR